MEDIKNKLTQNANNFDNLISNVDIPYIGAISTAELFKYYELIKDKWSLGSNTVNGLGTVIQRSYTELEFSTTKGKVEEIDLGFYDEEYEGRRFYHVLTPFREHEYQGIGPTYTEWLHSVEEIYLEQYFNNENPITSKKSIEVPLPAIGATNIENDTSSLALTQVILAREQIIKAKIKAAERAGKKFYEFSTDFNIGNAFGISFEANAKFDLYQTKEDKEPLEKDILVSKKYSPLINIPSFYIAIPILTAPETVITATLWGTKEKYKGYLYAGELEDLEETLMHRPTETNNLKPPGKEYLPDNFWNNRNIEDLPSDNNIFNKINSNYGWQG
jgi:hypothetical protein